jgi:hypothetical protein
MLKQALRIVVACAVLIAGTSSFAGQRPTGSARKPASQAKLAAALPVRALEGLRGDLLRVLAGLARFVPVPVADESFGTNGLTDTPDPTSASGGEDGEKAGEDDRRDEHEDAANEGTGGGHSSIAKR